MAEKPALKIKAKRKDKTGGYIDIAACWRNQFGGMNAKVAPNVQIMVDGKDIGPDYWINVFENDSPTSDEAQALIGKIRESFEFPG